MGRVGSVYGVKGWVKVHSFTQPCSNILDYRRWLLRWPDGRSRSIEVAASQFNGSRLTALLSGCADREMAQSFVGAEIMIDPAELPDAGVGEYYWYQIEGLNVVSVDGSSLTTPLGVVQRLLDTGANDVLVVKDSAGKVRLIPWVEDDVVVDVDLGSRTIQVRWDPDD